MAIHGQRRFAVAQAPASPPARAAMGATPSVQEDLQKLKTSPPKSRPRREAFQRLQRSLGCWIVAIHSRLLLCFWVYHIVSYLTIMDLPH